MNDGQSLAIIDEQSFRVWYIASELPGFSVATTYTCDGSSLTDSIVLQQRQGTALTLL